MEYSWISYKIIDDRIDSLPYKKQYLNVLEKLNKHTSVKNMEEVCENIKCGPFGSTILAEEYKNEGMLYIRPVNITENTFDDDNITFLSEELVKEKKLDVFTKNDLFFGRVGNPCVGKVTDQYKQITISPNIIGVKVGNKIDSDYLWMFCRSIYGLYQIKRMLKVVAQPTTSTEVIKKMKIYFPNSQIQKYIGDKVRKSAISIEEAKKVRKQSENMLMKELDLINLTSNIKDNENTKISWVLQSDLKERIDSDYYKCKYINLDKYNIKRKSIKIKDLIKELRKGTEIGSALYDENNKDGVKFIRVSDICYGEVKIENAISIKNGLDLDKRYITEKGDFILTKDGTLGLCAIIDDLSTNNYISGSIVKIKFKEKNFAYYLFWLFNMEIIKLQFERNSYGSIIKHLRVDDIEEISIPIIEEKYKFDILVENAKKYFEYIKISKQLIQEAKQDVENLIEGNFDMSKLN